VLGSVYPNEDANLNIVNNLSGVLKNNNNIEYYLITQYKKFACSEMMDGITMHRVFVPEFQLRKGKKSLFQDILNTIIHGLRYAVTGRRYYIQFLYKHGLDKLLSNKKFDVTIAISAPFFPVFCLLKSKTQTPVIYYQLDPYMSHSSCFANVSKKTGVKRYNKRLSEEKSVCQLSRKIIMTELIYNDYQNSELSEYLKKSEILDFPNLKRREFTSDSSYNIHYDKNKINLTFSGYLYNNYIRQPDFMFKLIRLLCAKRSDVMLNLVGSYNLEVFKPSYINEFIRPIQKNITFWDKVKSEFAINSLLQSDILINIGNTIPNQIPSKIIDYISTGKPIINICKLKNCPTIKYTERYPACLNIFEEDGLPDRIVDNVYEFCLENKERQIPYENIEKLYPECSTLEVAQRLMSIIEDAVNNEE